MTTVTPRPTDRYRPRADRDTLTSLIREATQAFSAKLKAEVEAANPGGIIAAWLEVRYPQADMAVLQRYGFAKPRDKVTVSAADEYFGIDLGRELLLPDLGALRCCERRFSEMPGYGLNPDYLAELTASGGLEAYLEDHRQREAGFLPKELDPVFITISDARREFQRVTDTAYRWPELRKAQTGEWPTWADIAAEFPMIADRMADQRLAA